MNSNNKILGWHFSNDTKLGYKDNRPIVIGETLSVEGDIIPCEFGLHASEKAFDAFRYVPCKYLWRVELEEDLQDHKGPNGIVDKWVGRKRKVLAGGDATEMLQKFGRECALDVFHLWPNAPKEVKTFLETGVMTEFVKKYFRTNSNNANDDDAYEYYNAYNAAFNAYYACKTNNIYYVRNVIFFAPKVLDFSYEEIYTNKFEQACLKFIAEKS